jgi:hypothetical protein
MEVETCPRCGESETQLRPACLHHPLSVRVESPSFERLEAAAALVLKGWSVKRAAAAYRLMKEDLREHVECEYS